MSRVCLKHFDGRFVEAFAASERVDMNVCITCLVCFLKIEMFVGSLGQRWYLMQDDASMYQGCKPPRMPEACSFKESLAQMFEFRKLQKLWCPDEIRGIFSKVDSSLGVSVLHIRTDTVVRSLGNRSARCPTKRDWTGAFATQPQSEETNVSQGRAAGTTLPKTDGLPLKIGPNPKGTYVVFQPSIFRGELLVSGRVSVFLGS